MLAFSLVDFYLIRMRQQVVSQKSPQTSIDKKKLQKARKRHRRRKTCREYLNTILNASSCKCGAVTQLTFHHRDPSQKEAEVTRFCQQGSMEKMKKEMEKCDILCFSCHRDIHLREAWYKKHPTLKSKLRWYWYKKVQVYLFQFPKIKYLCKTTWWYWNDLQKCLRKARI